MVQEQNVIAGKKRSKACAPVARQANREFFSCFDYFPGCDRTAAALQAICKEYYQRLCKLESEKYDTEYLVRQKDYEVSDVKPPVPPYRHPRAKEKICPPPLHSRTLIILLSLISEGEIRL